MFKQILKGSSIFVVLLAGNFSALAPVAASQLPTEFQISQAQNNVSPQELQQFASVLPSLQQIFQTGEQRSLQVIEQSGLTVERYQELSQGQQQPTSPEEQQSFNQAASQINMIEDQTTSQQEEVLRAGGIEPNRFNEIVAAIQQDPALQQQLQQMMQNN
jgi:hypothetical protein